MAIGASVYWWMISQVPPVFYWKTWTFLYAIAKLPHQNGSLVHDVPLTSYKSTTSQNTFTSIPMFPCPPDLTQIHHIYSPKKQHINICSNYLFFVVFAKAHTVESYLKNCFETLSYYSCIRITPIAGASKWNHLLHLGQGIWWCRHLDPTRFDPRHIGRAKEPGMIIASYQMRS